MDHRITKLVPVNSSPYEKRLFELFTIAGLDFNGSIIVSNVSIYDVLAGVFWCSSGSYLSTRLLNSIKETGGITGTRLRSGRSKVLLIV